jgi:hypothetical protein
VGAIPWRFKSSLAHHSTRPLAASLMVFDQNERLESNVSSVVERQIKFYHEYTTTQSAIRLVLWALFFSAVFLIFAFRGLIAVQFMHKINVDPNAHLQTDESLTNTTTDQSSSSAESNSNVTAPTTPLTNTATPSGETYTVKDGDTLYAVGQKLGKDWKQIAELNGLTPPYSLNVGQTIKLP